ncbi:MAG: hypothetical protein L0H36_01145 [bacterium]|nr:hypothetical protein [bacterium]MDN5835224.1 hypothetical protein [bacterium]
MEREQVQFESPFGAETAEDVLRNVAYAYIGMRDSLLRGEAPFASHLLYTQMLDDQDKLEREIGIEAGLEIGKWAVRTVVYEDLGISRGMHYGIENANKLSRPVEYRRLYDETLDGEEISRLVMEDYANKFKSAGDKLDGARAIYTSGMNN